ncbi:hypothetical protein LFZ51_19355 [Salmonella enterica subsp. arizonae serovar 63:g,z51:- str. So 20/20]|nr:hypothetical protein LFZ51_19355 [Salmonella enterica subsp. arizonae serovar 63:g,z51:- str. So 20/20]
MVLHFLRDFFVWCLTMISDAIVVIRYMTMNGLALKYKTPDDIHQALYRQKTVCLYQDQPR